MIVIGLMSGTSLDGISAAAVRFTEDTPGMPRAEILGFHVAEYNDEQRSRISGAIDGASADAYCRLNYDLGHWLADAALGVINEAGVPRSEIAAIASHGQTLWHAAPHSTWQSGEAAVLAERTGIDVVADFRVRDVAAGGQGAPLVPMADAMLFSHPLEWRVLQNLGGIGNLTIVPPGGGVDATRAFDTGPGVVIIDAVTRRLVPKLRFDVDGRLARRGEVISAVVDNIASYPYFSAPPPKSTGRELFTPAFIDHFMSECEKVRAGASPADVIATAVALTARTISDAFARFVPEPVSEVLLSGGGAKNPVLFEAIATALAPRRVARISDVYFDGEAKEAVAFALLGYLFLQRRAGNVPRVTGAAGPRILGKLTPA
jgi:anhydro-N-acetylmuramic acid kinase